MKKILILLMVLTICTGCNNFIEEETSQESIEKIKYIENIKSVSENTSQENNTNQNTIKKTNIKTYDVTVIACYKKENNSYVSVILNNCTEKDIESLNKNSSTLLKEYFSEYEMTFDNDYISVMTENKRLNIICDKEYINKFEHHKNFKISVNDNGTLNTAKMIF